MNLRRDRVLNCYCGVLMLFVNMGMLSTAFSTYFPYIRELKGFSNTEIYLLTTTRSVFAMLVMANADRYFRFLDIKKGTMLTFAAAALGFAVMAFTPDARLYYLGTSLFGMAYGLGGMIPASILLRRWYPEHSGTAIGIAATGSGVAGMVIPPLIASLVGQYGLSATFAAQSGLILLLMFPLALFVKDRPEAGELRAAEQEPETEPADEGTPDRENAARDSACAGSGSGVSEASAAKAEDGFRLRDHRRLLLGMVLMGLLGFQPAAGFSMLFRTSGYGMDRVALILSLMGLFLIPAKIVVGRFADRFGGRRMLRDCTLLLSAMLLVFSFTAHLPYPVIIAVMFFFAFGVSETSVGISVIAGDYTSPAHYAEALKTCQFCYALGGLLFSTVNGVTADLTGSYAPAYALYAAAGLVLLAVLLPGYPGRSRKSQGDGSSGPVD